MNLVWFDGGWLVTLADGSREWAKAAPKVDALALFEEMFALPPMKIQFIKSEELWKRDALNNRAKLVEQQMADAADLSVGVTKPTQQTGLGILGYGIINAENRS